MKGCFSNLLGAVVLFKISEIVNWLFVVLLKMWRTHHQFWGLSMWLAFLVLYVHSLSYFWLSLEHMPEFSWTRRELRREKSKGTRSQEPIRTHPHTHNHKVGHMPGLCKQWLPFETYLCDNMNNNGCTTAVSRNSGSTLDVGLGNGYGSIWVWRSAQFIQL